MKNGLYKKRANSKLKVFPADFKAIKQQFLIDIKLVVVMEEIPEALILIAS